MKPIIRRGRGIFINPEKLPFPTQWRTLANYWELSHKARQRLEWFIFYYTVGKKNASSTASYFGIAPKTFHFWKKRFALLRIFSLEEHPRSPHHKRPWQVTREQELRIIQLRKQYIKYGKRKLKILYKRLYLEDISTWKIERVIRKHNLYPDPETHKKRYLRVRKKKKRIHDIAFPPGAGKLWHTDTIILWWYGVRRVIFTAVEHHTKLGFARVYRNASSQQAADFLKRLMYLTNGEIKIIHPDNGSEFAGEFERACKELNIEQVYSRVRQPKDNPALERFNWTVQDEWLSLSEVGLDDVQEANTDITDWLIEYNSIRPYESLDYKTPIEYAQFNYFKELPMYPARTNLENIL